MKRNIRKIAMTLLAGSLIWSTSGCTSSIDEINRDPDNAAKVPNDNLLAYSIYSTSYRFNDRWFAMDEPMSFCGYLFHLLPLLRPLVCHGRTDELLRLCGKDELHR